MRYIVAVICLGIAASSTAQSVTLPDPPQALANLFVISAQVSNAWEYSSTADLAKVSEFLLPLDQQTSPPVEDPSHGNAPPKPHSSGPVDANGIPIPLDRREPQRILGFMPNFRTVSGGAKPPPPGWKYNFTVATHQATDYSSFIFLGITSLTAEGTNTHPALGKGIGGFYAYNWRGFLDKTDNTYLSAWLFASALHEDTRYYELGNSHSIAVRSLYVISRQAVTRTYGGRETPNIAGIGGKVLTQVVSRYYYPPSATTFPVLASKFGYSVMRDIAFSAVREFYPDIAAHFIRKHREKMARLAAQDAASAP